MAATQASPELVRLVCGPFLSTEDIPACMERSGIKDYSFKNKFTVSLLPPKPACIHDLVKKNFVKIFKRRSMRVQYSGFSCGLYSVFSVCLSALLTMNKVAAAVLGLMLPDLTIWSSLLSLPLF